MDDLHAQLRALDFGLAEPQLALQQPAVALSRFGVTAFSRLTRVKAGGARRDRTDDLKLAKLALSQLSYGP